MDYELGQRMQKAIRQLQFLLKAKKGYDQETERIKILEELLKEQNLNEASHSSARPAR